MIDYKNIIEILTSKKRLIISGHIDPDADAIGSMLALYQAFDGAAKNWLLIAAAPLAADLRFLPGSELIKSPESIDFTPDGLLLVDCTTAKRAGLEPPESAIPVYCIDHHPAEAASAQIAVIEPEASATGEIVSHIITAAEREINRDIAMNLYSAIVSDTGGFRYPNTNPEALAICADLLEYGLDLEDIRINLFENRSLANMYLIGKIFANMQVKMDGRLCLMFFRYEDLLSCGATQDDCSNMANFPILLSGVKVGLLFEEHADYVKVSLRGRKGYAVNEIAKSFGGGGHMYAAGCIIEGRLEEVMPLVVARVEEAFT
jgi:phosphoesterase RecJ-like protein